MAPEPNSGWDSTRAKILMVAGLAVIVAEFVNAEVLGGTFHEVFVFGGLALCGISIAQWGERK